MYRVAQKVSLQFRVIIKSYWKPTDKGKFFSPNLRVKDTAKYMSQYLISYAWPDLQRHQLLRFKLRYEKNNCIWWNAEMVSKNQQKEKMEINEIFTWISI